MRFRTLLGLIVLLAGLGVLLKALGVWDAPEPGLGPDALQRDCDRGRAEACQTLGFLYMGGEGAEPDSDRALALFSRACERGSAKGCHNLGAALQNSDEQRGAEIAALFERACDGGELAGCTALADMLLSARQIEADYDRALTLFRRSCAGDGHDGCAGLGFMYLHGYGVEADPERAVTLFILACDRGEAVGCLNFSYLRETGLSDDVRAAASARAQQCLLSGSPDCYE